MPDAVPLDWEFRVHVGGRNGIADIEVQLLSPRDLFFRGRIPFVGQADSRRWIASLDRLIEVRPSLVVPGHGPLSREPMADLVLTRDYLLDRVWGLDYYGESRTLDVHIRRVRKKLNLEAYIETVIGVGYRFVGQTADSKAEPRPQESGALG